MLESIELVTTVISFSNEKDATRPRLCLEEIFLTSSFLPRVEAATDQLYELIAKAIFLFRTF